MNKIINYILEHKKLIAVIGAAAIVLASVFILEGKNPPKQVSNINDNINDVTENPTESTLPIVGAVINASAAPSQSPTFVIKPTEKTHEYEEEQNIIYNDNINEEYYADIEYSIESGMEINPETGNDMYMTEPVPEGKPIPQEPQETIIKEEEHICTIAVSCKTLLINSERLNKEKHELVPEDGYILKPEQAVFYEGESVFNVLQRTLKQKKIHMEFSDNPIYNSAYIEGINNLYEFDAGTQSGWVYRVNDWFPNYGCSRYVVNDGDMIEFLYTCDRGRDVGGHN